MKSKIVSAAEAVALIHDGDTLVCSGFGMVGVPDALLVALETPDAEARWLAGEDIFAGVAHEQVRAAEQEQNRRIIDQLVAGALGRDMP